MCFSDQMYKQTDAGFIGSVLTGVLAKTRIIRFVGKLKSYRDATLVLVVARKVSRTLRFDSDVIDLRANEENDDVSSAEVPSQTHLLPATNEKS